jgi:serine phosphatase RsbU (regulator of sigma subunit)
MKRSLFIFIVLNLISFQLSAKYFDIDSLKVLLHKEKSPKRIIELKCLIGEYSSIERIPYWDSIIADAKKIDYLYGVTYASFMNSLNYTKTAQFDFAVESAEQALKYSKMDKDSVWMGYAIEHLGSLNFYINEIETAKDYFNDALKIFEAINLSWRNGYILIKIGELYESENDSINSLNLYRESNAFFLNNKDNIGLSLSYSKIGAFYKNNNQLDSALLYLENAISIRNEKNQDEYHLVYILNDLANVYFQLGYKTKAYETIHNSLKEAQRINDMGLAFRDINHFLYLYYKDAKDFKKSLHHKEISDSLDNVLDSEDNKKAILKQQAKYYYDTQKEIDKLEHSKQIELEKQETQKQRMMMYFVVVFLFIVLLFSIFIYNRFKITQKQKLIIEEKEKETAFQKELIEIKQKETEHQKDIIEEKHKEITDSINYAERIQRSFLASKEMLDHHLSLSSGGVGGGGGYFVFFKPKDVVSGDFYWASQLNNSNFAFCCADSTGHGVPGAIMSILNISSLEKAIEKETEPHHILGQTRELIIERLKKDGSPEGGKDGMDCSLLVLNQDKTLLTFASANNPVFIVTTKNEVAELVEAKPDKMPVGKHDKDQTPFTLQTVTLQKGDVIYTLTDGMPDQFGGEKGKKYMIKNLKNLFLSIAHLPMAEQHTKLEEEFINWKGENEQVDDVCIIGVQV